MADAKITTADGILVEVTGTPEEVSTIVERLRTGGTTDAPRKRQGKHQRKVQEPKSMGKGLISDLIGTLKGEGFFKPPKGLGETRAKLADLGHHYPLTTLSGAMQKQAKSRQLRRFKQEGKYVYAQ